MSALRAFEVTVPNDKITYLVGTVSSCQNRGFLVVVHGRSRSVKIAEAFAEKAHEEGYIILAPMFNIENYNGFQLLRGRDGPCAAADALNVVCDDAARRFHITSSTFQLVGFSAGAQFAHRYAMRSPERVTGLVAAAAGWYTMPYPRVAFPFGLAPSIDMPEGIQDIGAFLGIPTRVMAGEKDIMRGKQLRTTPAVDEDQGLHRLERARRWVDAMARCTMGTDSGSNISMEILPNSGHSASEVIHNGSFVQRTINFLTNNISPG